MLGREPRVRGGALGSFQRPGAAGLTCCRGLGGASWPSRSSPCCSPRGGQVGWAAPQVGTGVVRSLECGKPSLLVCLGSMVPASSVLGPPCSALTCPPPSCFPCQVFAARLPGGSSWTFICPIIFCLPPPHT